MKDPYKWTYLDEYEGFKVSYDSQVVFVNSERFNELDPAKQEEALVSVAQMEKLLDDLKELIE